MNMVGARRLVTVTLAWLFMSAKTPGVDGYRPSFLEDANVAVTEETPDFRGSANTSGIIQAQDSEQFENGTTLGCPCDMNDCERFCCPRGYSYSFVANDCTADKLTPQVHDFEGSIENYHVMSHVIDWSSGARGYECWHTPIPHLRNGSICRMNLTGYPHFEDFCLYRDLNKSNYWILRCNQLSDPNEIEQVGYEKRLLDVFRRSWASACTGSASLVALATFIVHSSVPELKNFQGRIVRSYLASYFSFMMVLTSIFLHIGFPDIALIVQGILLMYFGLACLLWLNVMSLDVWRAFRKFRSSQAVNAKDRQRATFVRYSMYAWGSPVILILVTGIVLILWGTGFVVLGWLLLPGIAVCNTYFFVSTALTIKKCNKETAQMFDDANKHHQKNKQWFNLYLKLFLIMGCPIILWAVAMAWHTRMCMLVVYTLEPPQAICVFYMFVWKDDVKRSIREKFAGMLRRLGWCRQRDSTSDIQNGIEE